jgi:hypothetical protein
MSHFFIRKYMYQADSELQKRIIFPEREKGRERERERERGREGNAAALLLTIYIRKIYITIANDVSRQYTDTRRGRSLCLSIKWKNVLISRMARDYGHNGDCLKALCCREWEARTTMPRRTVPWPRLISTLFLTPAFLRPSAMGVRVACVIKRIIRNFCF